ncbi:MAG: efflux RND transporter periplasmic adaptor subunit [Acidobacteriota bacterium]|nr:MAG: efflux RND transporter periplasmic adaptor subunit [Acidobacteriota bacterium]
MAFVTVETQSVSLTTELPGRIAPMRIAEIRPQASGLLLKRHFVEGADVRTGQLLYEIDSRPFEAAVEQANAALDFAQKNAERTQAALTQSLANVERQKATLKLAQQLRQRVEASYQERAVSAIQLDEAVTSEQVAAASLTALNAQIESDRRTIAAAEAAIRQAEAALRATEVNLTYTRIDAPITGRIGRSYSTEGAMLTAYQPNAMATIQQLDPIYVDVVQSTAELLRLRDRLEKGLLHSDENLQRKVRLHLENSLLYPHEGTFQFRDVSVDPTAGTVVLRMVFPNPDRLLLPGMFVRAIVQEGVNPQAVLVPQQAVLRDLKGAPYVLVLDDDETAQVRNLTTERTIGDTWLVSEGLEPGNRVIVEGLQFVRHGMKVQAVPWQSSPAAGPPPASAAAQASSKTQDAAPVD